MGRRELRQNVGGAQGILWALNGVRGNKLPSINPSQILPFRPLCIGGYVWNIGLIHRSESVVEPSGALHQALTCKK